MSAKLQKIFPHLLAALSGLLLALAYPPYDVLGLIWIGLLPLFFVLFVPKSSDKNTDLGPRHALGIGMIFGLIYFGITYLPLLHTYPLGWAGITSPAIGLSLVFGIWALITFLGALPYSLLVLTTLFIKKRLTADRAIAIFPFLWVIFEYLRAYFISIALYGKGALLGAHWTNGHLGYALHDNSILLQSADLWGVYGLSLLVVAINAAVFYIGLSYVLHRRVLWSKILIPFLILLVALAYGAWRIKNIEQATAATKSVNVALIQTDFQPNYIAGDEYLRAVQSTIAALVNEAIKNNSEIIVLPEGSQFLPTTAASTLAAAQKPFILIDNAAIKTANGLTNSTLYFDSEQKLVAVSEKMLLVFFGEYLPYIFKIPAKLAGAGELVASFEARRNRVPGAEIKILRTAFG
ncbi:MAG: hypothetical protein HZA25_02645, partial [Candidatus Niyogibacteria bacterium]|nr:hypothetical protein [Candidatus Niyogibacteria bacterium]